MYALISVLIGVFAVGNFVGYNAFDIFNGHSSLKAAHQSLIKDHEQLRGQYRAITDQVKQNLATDVDAMNQMSEHQRVMASLAAVLAQNAIRQHKTECTDTKPDIASNNEQGYKPDTARNTETNSGLSWTGPHVSTAVTKYVYVKQKPNRKVAGPNDICVDANVLHTIGTIR